MKTARIKWRSTYKLRYDEVHQDCPVCGAEFTQQEGVI